MQTASRYKQVAALFRERVKRGDYHLREIPSTRAIAAEVGVSHIVARKALELLVEEGSILRSPNGRLQPNADSDGPDFAILIPAYPTGYRSQVMLSVARVAKKRGWNPRQVVYVHWGDVSTDAATRAFPGVLLFAVAEDIPDGIAGRLARNSARLATVNLDLTHVGAPCLKVFSEANFRDLFEHVYRLGHRRIGCFNAQPSDPIIRDRIRMWRDWSTAKGVAGPCINRPVASYESAIAGAYASAQSMFDGDADARDCPVWFCPTAPVARGLMRAMVDRGLTPGVDRSVVGPEENQEASFNIPRLTSIAMADLDLRIERLLDWLVTGQNLDPGSLLLPQRTTLNLGETVATVTSGDNG